MLFARRQPIFPHGILSSECVRLLGAQSWQAAFSEFILLPPGTHGYVQLVDLNSGMSCPVCDTSPTLISPTGRPTPSPKASQGVPLTTAFTDKHDPTADLFSADRQPNQRARLGDTSRSKDRPLVDRARPPADCAPRPPSAAALTRLGYSSQLLETVLRLPCGRVNHAPRHSFACRCMQAGQY
jgi:hypothetical protein